MTLKEQVEDILKIYPETRNSDIKLTLNIWVKYFPKQIKFVEGERYIKLKDLYSLPREDNVKRIRAKFNERGDYLPTNPEVLKQRGLKEKEWKQDMLNFK